MKTRTWPSTLKIKTKVIIYDLELIIFLWNLFSSPERKFLNKHCYSHCFHMASSFLNLFLFCCNCLAISTFFLFILLGRFLKMTAWPCLFLRDSNYKVVHRVHLFWKSSLPNRYYIELSKIKYWEPLMNGMKNKL